MRAPGRQLIRPATILLAVIGLATGCAGQQPEPSGSPAAPSGSVSAPTAKPTATPKLEYQSFEDLVVGDCFDPVEDRDDEALIAGIVRRCDEPHLMEVIGIPELDYAEAAPFPGDSRIDRESEDACRAEFKTYVGVDFDDSSLSATYYPPSAQTWELGDRLVLCVVDSTEIAPLTQSVKDSEA